MNQELRIKGPCSSDLITIVVPTNRKLTDVETSLRNLKHVSEQSGFTIVVSDNSKDEDKQATLHQIFGNDYFESEFDEAIGNWSFGLSQVRTEFVGFMADDDWVFSLPGSLPQKLPEEYVGISPVFLNSSPDLGYQSVRNFSLVQSVVTDRMAAHSSQTQGLNNLLYAYWRTDLFRNISKVNQAHPCGAGYQDWVMVMAMVAEGKVLPTLSLMYNYRNDNWFGPKPLIDEEFARLLERCDLPKELADQQGALRVLDLICFFGRADGYRLTEVDRLSVLDSQLKELIGSYSRALLPDLITACLDAVDNVSHEAYLRYKSYVHASLTGGGLESHLK